MGLNLDVDHVAFAGTRKFDGQNHRKLTPAELGQIAGRAGRHMNDGTFGVTGAVEPFDADLIERLETHNFDSVRVLQWRNRELDFAHARAPARQPARDARHERGSRAPAWPTTCWRWRPSARDPRDRRAGRARRPPSRRLWDVCQIPDYRKISGQNHAELVATLYKFLMGPEERIPEDWFAKQVAFADRTDGDIDTLANRIAHIRTWTFVSNRADWLKDPEHWQERTRAIEDSLSDALHEQLTQRFVDRRTSALMKGMRDKDELHAEIADDGAIHVENHFVGRLQGLPLLARRAGRRHPRQGDAQCGRAGARQASWRCARAASPPPSPMRFKLTRSGRILWRDEEIAQLEAGEDPLKPTVVAARRRASVGARPGEGAGAARRLADRDRSASRLKPLVEIAQGRGHRRPGARHRLPAEARTSASCGARRVAEEIKSLDQTGARAAAQVRRALRRLQHLLPDPAEAGRRRADA